jgi:hypothetical protein
MPMGPGPIAFAAFVGVKFVGYTAAAYALRRAYPESKSSIAKVGAVRTTIGIVAGVAYGGLWILGTSHYHGPQSSFLEYSYFAGLFPIRICEWFLLLHLYFDSRLRIRYKAVKTAVAGTIWSYCLDAIGVGAALVIPGGFWVC